MIVVGRGSLKDPVGAGAARGRHRGLAGLRPLGQEGHQPVHARGRVVEDASHERSLAARRLARAHRQAAGVHRVERVVTEPVAPGHERGVDERRPRPQRLGQLRITPRQHPRHPVWLGAREQPPHQVQHAALRVSDGAQPPRQDGVGLDVRVGLLDDLSEGRAIDEAAAPHPHLDARVAARGGVVDAHRPRRTVAEREHLLAVPDGQGVPAEVHRGGDAVGEVEAAPGRGEKEDEEVASHEVLLPRSGR